jgi:photosystem II protein
MQTSLMQKRALVAGSRVAAPFRPAVSSTSRPSLVCEAARLEFIRGIDEPTIPEVRLSRSRTGASGSALFIFDQPSIFQASGDIGDITGLFMEDDEGTLTTTDVKAKFVNGKPQAIEARYAMRSGFEWDRFMRFMDRYAEQKGLGFEKG